MRAQEKHAAPASKSDMQEMAQVRQFAARGEWHQEITAGKSGSRWLTDEGYVLAA